MPEIRLSNGETALVDSDDFEYLSQWKWGVVKNPNGKVYAARGTRTDGQYRKVLMHVEIAKRKGIYEPGKETDHENRNTLDNRRRNLRMLSKSRNQHNAGARRDSSTGVRGVSLKPNGLWRARIQVDNKRCLIGDFKTLDEAKRVRQHAEGQYFSSAPRVSSTR